jgi:maleylacetate reductase
MGRPGEDSGDALDAFIRGLGVPRSLGEVKIRPENLRPHRKAGDGHAVGAPQSTADPGPEQVREILELAA